MGRALQGGHRDGACLRTSRALYMSCSPNCIRCDPYIAVPPPVDIECSRSRALLISISCCQLPQPSAVPQKVWPQTALMPMHSCPCAQTPRCKPLYFGSCSREAWMCGVTHPGFPRPITREMRAAAATCDQSRVIAASKSNVATCSLSRRCALMMFNGALSRCNPS